MGTTLRASLEKLGGPHAIAIGTRVHQRSIEAQWDQKGGNVQA
jgi:hypothetical protein